MSKKNKDEGIKNKIIDGLESETKKQVDELKTEAKNALVDGVKSEIKNKLGLSIAGTAINNNPIMLKIKLIILGVLILGSYVGLCYFYPGLNPFHRNPLILKNTAVVIKESKKIAKLFSSTYYAEVVMDTTKLTIEVKTDYKALQTGNVFVEYFSRGKESGISVSQSDWYCFIISNDNIIFIKTKKLKVLCRKYLNTTKEVLGGDNNTSAGILLPLKELIQ